MDEIKTNNRDLLAIFLKCSLYSTLVFIILGLSSYALVQGSRYVSDQANKLEEYANYRMFQAKEYIAESMGLVNYNVKISEPEAPVEDRDALINAYSEKYGIDPIVMKPIFHQESNNNPFRWRYEELWEKEYKSHFPCPSSYNPEECKMWFSSVGEGQVSFPVWHEKCKVNHPMELVNRKTNYECSFTIISECLFEQLKNVAPDNLQANAKALRTCYRKYNGSGAKAEEYAEGRMAALANYTIEKTKLISVIKEMKETEKQEKIDSKKNEEEEKAKVAKEIENKIAMLDKK